MFDFTFVSPTKLIFGRNSENQVGATAASFGFKKTLVVYGSDRVKENGLIDKVVSLLKENGVEPVVLGGVRINPTLEFVSNGLKVARENKIDSLIAVGGGSVIDTAKSIATSFHYEGDPYDFNRKIATPKDVLPIGVILTISAAGSELSNSCVISNDATMEKKGFNSDLIRPVFAIENPEFTYTLPPYHTAAGIADMMAHTLERYFGPSDDNQLADDWALALVKNVVIAGKRAMENPCDYDARAQLMLDSSYAHNGITAIGKDYQFVVHAMEHGLSGYKPDIVHGAGIALLYPAWAEYVYEKDPAKFAKLGRVVFDVVEKDDIKASIISIRRLREFFSSIGMPASFKDVGLTKEDLPSLVALVSGNGTRVIGRFPQSLDAKDIEAIFASLL